MKTKLLLVLAMILLVSCKTVKKLKSEAHQDTDSVSVKHTADIHSVKVDSTYKLISTNDYQDKADSNYWGRVIKRWWFSFDTIARIPVLDRAEEITEQGGSIRTEKKTGDSLAITRAGVRSDSTAKNSSDSTHVVASSGQSMNKTTRNALVSNFFFLAFAIFLVSFAFNKLKFTKITPLV